MSLPSIRWDEVRSRLQSSEQSLRATLAESPEKIRAAYRKRAARLASLPDGQQATSKDIAALIFRLGKERCAIPLTELAEVLPFRSCTRVPGAAPHVLGVIDLRGEIRAVVDLAYLISRSSSSHESGALLVLRRCAALKVDGIEDLREIDSSVSVRFIGGQYIGALASNTLGLLDVETVLSAIFAPKES